jgi:hypothetical protein
MPGFDNWIPVGHESEVLLKMREVRANALGPRGRACEERGEKREAAVMEAGVTCWGRGVQRGAPHQASTDTWAIASAKPVWADKT